MSHRARFTRIAVAVDFSPGAPVAISRAAWLPLAREATISLVHAVPDSVPAAAHGRMMEEAARTVGRFAEDLRARVRSRLELDVEVESAVVVGTPFIEIIRHARSRGAELIVVGRRDPPRRRDGVGSMAERVIRKGDVPVLLANDEAEGPYQRALLAIDLSDASRRVGELALALLPDGARALRVVHALHISFAHWFGAETLDAYRREHEAHARVAMRRFEAMFEPFGIECRNVIQERDPRMAILREAVSTRADLIVLGTHGRSGVAHALLGSVAEWLVRTAPCDVAVTRPARFTFELP